MSIISLALFAVAPLALALPIQDAREDRFIYTETVPPIVGELREDFSREDGERDLKYTKRVFRYEGAEQFIVTHVTAVSCGVDAPAGREDFYVMAIQYLARVPASFAEAARHDFYKEVYVRDEDGRYRLYENVTGRDMLEIFERFEPDCVSL